MDLPPPKPHPTTYTHLLQTLTSFLTISIHSILYTRHIYPENTFILTRAYNYPVYQNRHPGVCGWVKDVVGEVVGLMDRGVERVGVVVYGGGGGDGVEGGGKGKGEVRVYERFMFDLSAFPRVSGRDKFLEIEREGQGGGERQRDGLVDIEEELRGAVGRLAGVGGRLGGLPGGGCGCGVGVVVEMGEGEGERERGVLGHPQPWIPAPPSQQSGKGKGKGREQGHKNKKTIPIRSVEAGEFVLEMWVEEGVKEGMDSVD